MIQLYRLIAQLNNGQPYTGDTSCSLDSWIQGDWHRCLFESTTALIGESTFGVLIGIGIYAGLYVAGGGRTTTPTVVVILLATLMFPLLPGQFNGIAWSVLLVGAAASMLQVMQKYVLSPATS
jgi:hypothetical protein